MPVGHHLSDDERGRAVGSLEAGQSVTTVAVAMGVSKSVISRLRKLLKVEKLYESLLGVVVGTPHLLEDLYVVLVPIRNRNLIPGQIAANLATTIGTHVSARAISR
ncbi:hypothetical protein TNCV_4079931 [Trichonephila clavipes]|nr:hypothetical protein TNCV_4079931 [Trichonephila clavipes]